MWHRQSVGYRGTSPDIASADALHECARYFEWASNLFLTEGCDVVATCNASSNDEKVATNHLAGPKTGP